ncbi:killer cell lectin-like receptor subfamily G member 1 isoform X1 [Heterocephalus glaber]|uniref:Killer cell lectin-like receptor subfamily G member 1 isoform X1 n=2 Tax=Heterocephalus glaber TaxID=10181 RepID=A0AAX6QB10_HETGA|nr:killer cell lectin-like receptor subfamily G member 1 isoform X1 [Heterocephalus glaber]
MEPSSSAIYSTLELPTAVQVQDDYRPQRRASSSKSSLFCLVVIVLGLLNILLTSLLLYLWIPGQGPSDSNRASCPSCPDFWMRFANHCYYFSVEKKDWNSSLQFCIARDAQLLIILDNQEMSLLQNLIDQDFHWIGLRKNSSWRWEDGSALNFSRVYSNSLVQRCGAVNKDGLQASSCEVPLRWVCKKVRL